MAETSIKVVIICMNSGESAMDFKMAVDWISLKFTICVLNPGLNSFLP